MKRPPVPEGTTPYIWKKFWRMFETGLAFWTSEDGNMTDLVIARRPDAAVILEKEFRHIEHIDWSKIWLDEAWVEQEWVGHEFYECNCSQGKVWRFQDHETPFPVFRLDLYKHIEECKK